jgi:hypothetical protein
VYEDDVASLRRWLRSRGTREKSAGSPSRRHAYECASIHQMRSMKIVMAIHANSPFREVGVDRCESEFETIARLRG